jgi:hypothetical protein
MMNECPVCLDDLSNKSFLMTACRHPICSECLIRLTEAICPCCRRNLTKQLPSAFLSIMPLKSPQSRTTTTTNRTINVYSLTDFPPL